MNRTDDSNFESRKKDHVDLAMQPNHQAFGSSGLDSLVLAHDSIPELNFDEVRIQEAFFVSGMTAGHNGAEQINRNLAENCAKHRWIFGLGSQRRQWMDPHYRDHSIQKIRSDFPELKIIANLGLSQLIEATSTGSIERVIALATEIQTHSIAIHLNPLQEAIQPEGTPSFRGGIQALQHLIESTSIPVMVKETGCGMSTLTLKKLSKLKLAAIDVSGLGGTHWGRIEGSRSLPDSIAANAAKTFENWGVSTVQSVRNARSIFSGEVWASGGVRTGLDAAKLFALGADRVGFAKPALEAALQGSESVHQWMNQIEHELKIALFCTGSKTIQEIRGKWEGTQHG